MSVWGFWGFWGFGGFGVLGMEAEARVFQACRVETGHLYVSFLLFLGGGGGGGGRRGDIGIEGLGIEGGGFKVNCLGGLGSWGSMCRPKSKLAIQSVPSLVQRSS